jgi:hypothetical protein
MRPSRLLEVLPDVLRQQIGDGAGDPGQGLAGVDGDADGLGLRALFAHGKKDERAVDQFGCGVQFLSEGGVVAAPGQHLDELQGVGAPWIVHAIAAAVNGRTIAAREIANRCIEAVAALNFGLNAIINIMTDLGMPVSRRVA